MEQVLDSPSAVEMLVKCDKIGAKTAEKIKAGWDMSRGGLPEWLHAVQACDVRYLHGACALRGGTGTGWSVCIGVGCLVMLACWLACIGVCSGDQAGGEFWQLI